MKVNIQEEIEKINHSRRLFDLLYTSKKIRQDQHRNIVSEYSRNIEILTKVFKEHGKEINV